MIRDKVGYLFIRSLTLGSRFPHSYVILFTLEQIIGKYFSIRFYSLCVAELEISNKILNLDTKNQKRLNG